MGNTRSIWGHAKLAVLIFAFAFLVLPRTSAQAQDPCHGVDDTEPDNPQACPVGIPPLPQGSFHAIPLMDGNMEDYYGEKVSLYGAYGNDERTDPVAGNPHYIEGTNRAAQIKPRALNGQVDLQNGSIVFLFIGFSNCTIEICGGQWNIWNGQDPNITGQPCSTNCNNPRKQHPEFQPWNDAGDGVTQRSFLYQVYSPNPHLVGPHVYVFDGAAGKQTLDKWDPSGYYVNHSCVYNGLPVVDPECDYDRAKRDLENNGFSENQVQAIFIKTANSYPNCDLSHDHCLNDKLPADAYQSEQRLGNILRYLKCCKLGTSQSRYPNLQQVFITSRIYGGYAKNPGDLKIGCLNPEPYAYEEGFAVQRIIVAQIKQQYGQGSNDQYSGLVDYAHAPWFDWGPYLWADGKFGRSDGVKWCNGQNDQFCRSDERDLRDGDISDPTNTYWGDFTHPSAQGAEKVANQLVKFIKGQLSQPQTFISDWVTPWKGK